MPLEVLDGPLVFLGRRAGGEGSEISALAGFGILLAGIEPEFFACDFSNHDRFRLKEIIARQSLVFLFLPAFIQSWTMGFE